MDDYEIEDDFQLGHRYKTHFRQVDKDMISLPILDLKTNLDKKSEYLSKLEIILKTDDLTRKLSVEKLKDYNVSIEEAEEKIFEYNQRANKLAVNVASNTFLNKYYEPERVKDYAPIQSKVYNNEFFKEAEPLQLKEPEEEEKQEEIPKNTVEEDFQNAIKFISNIVKEGFEVKENKVEGNYLIVKFLSKVLNKFISIRIN